MMCRSGISGLCGMEFLVIGILVGGTVIGDDFCGRH